MNVRNLFFKILSVFILLIIMTALFTSCLNEASSSEDLNKTDKSKLAFEKRDDGYWVVGIGKCAKSDITIPSTYKGEAVVGISESAFEYTYNINSISDHNDIISVTIGEGVKYIGERAFAGCGKLAFVSLPDSLLFIGQSAFSSCSALAEITLPKEITIIAPTTFKNCSNLTKVNALGKISVIGESAFYSCEKLSDFNFNEGLCEIGESAFSYCRALTELTLPDSLVSVGSRAFYNCSAVKALNIGRGLTVIPEGAFQSLTGLEELVIPDTVVEIQRNALDELTSLKSLTIPKSIKIMDYCLNGTRNIENVYYGGDLEDWVTIDMTTVGSSPFYYSLNAKLYLNGIAFEGDIVIPEKITRIDDNAFENYKYITSISFPHDMEYIGNNAFQACEGLLSVSFSGNVAEFGENIFRGCGNITSVDLGDKLTKVGYYMFECCGSLEKLVIPSNVKYLDWGSFAGGGLKELVISEGVEHIGASAFRNMEIDVIIPKSVKVIEFAAFSTDGKISYAGTVEEWQNMLTEHLWNEKYAEFIVYCIDGEVVIPHPYS